ncbi:MAG: hypothetical protein ACK4RK_20685 [Gemmataceae bacterium]
MSSDDAIRRFFRRHAGAAVGMYPVQSELETVSEKRDELMDWGIEQPADEWKPVVLPETPAHPGKVPERFIDGCQSGHAVACLRAPEVGWPIPVFLAEVGGVAMRLKGRELTRDFFGLDRVVSFVTDAFPWQEVEAFAAALANLSGFPLRVLPTDRPRVDDPIDLFDYEKMRKAAQNRANNEMANWEAIALAADRTTPTLCNGRLEPRLRSASAADRFNLVVGVVKTHSANLLHPQGWRTLLDLKPSQRTPFFRIAQTSKGEANDLPVVTWFIKMAGGDKVMPNWAAVRVEIPWIQFQRQPEAGRTGFVNRLSRWLIDARCRQQSYARMAVSLEPIVRAEDSLKSLFTPFGVLRNRFLRHAGVIGSASP